MAKERSSEQVQNTSENTSEEVDRSQEESQDQEGSNSQTDGQHSQQVEEFEVQASPEAVEYKHPLLRGKTPEEIERLFQTQEEALRDQNTELNRLHSSRTAQTQESAPAPVEDDVSYGDDFLAPRFKTLEQRLSKHLERMVEPLNRQIHQGQATSARGRMRETLKHFSVLEPHIDRLLREQGKNPDVATEQELTMLYHTAVGLATERGINLSQAHAQESAPTPQTPPATERREPQMNIPQHRPSSAPLPKGSTPSRRELSENEKRLAKEYFPTSQDPEGDYLNLQSADEEEIVKPGFSKENW